MRPHLATLVSVLALTGCASAHEGVDVGSGLYELTVAGEADACSPARTTGAMGIVGIVSQAGALHIAVPESGGLARVSLLRSEGFHTATQLDLPGCAGATLTRSWTVVDATPTGFSIAFAEGWSGMGSCGSASGMPGAPIGDCAANLRLDYQLDQACAAPCEIVLASGAVSCACP